MDAVCTPDVIARGERIVAAFVFGVFIHEGVTGIGYVVAIDKNG